MSGGNGVHHRDMGPKGIDVANLFSDNMMGKISTDTNHASTLSIPRKAHAENSSEPSVLCETLKATVEECSRKEMKEQEIESVSPDVKETVEKTLGSAENDIGALKKEKGRANQDGGGDAGESKERNNNGNKKKVIPAPTPITNCGKIPDDASVWDNAVLLIDKPKGWTSFDVCGKLRGSLGGLLRRKPRQIKVGHAGTLDPMATGLLIVCVGRGTKSIDNFVAMEKEYSGIMKLGEATDSYDADGTVIETHPWEHITDDELLSARNKFLGDIEQVPPMFSALKVGGKRLYEAARQGKEIERKPRKIFVGSFDISRDPNDKQCIHFRVSCSKGTYIRSLAHDLGKSIGSAAHLVALRREAIGEFRVDKAWKMEELVDAIVEQRNEIKAKRSELHSETRSDKPNETKREDIGM